MCDKKNSVLFTETECLILSPSFKLLDESQVVLRAPRKDDVYSLDLKNIIPSGGITCLYANAIADESKLWHRRLGHVNFKNINKLVKGHLVRGLPSKVFVNDHTCVAYKKGKQHKASYLVGCDNGTEFKNHAMNEFYAKKGIKREFSVARTPQQNGVTERKNRTLIEAARTMLADSLLLFPFCAEAVNIACYVLNRGKFDGKSDEGYLLGYSTTSKAFRVYNKRTKRVEENLHIDFLEDQPNVAGTSPNWMFDLDFLTNSMNYIPVSVENQVIVDAEDEQVWKDELEMMVTQELVANAMNDESRQAFEEEKRRIASQKKAAQATSTNQLSTDRPFVSTDRSFVSTNRSNTPNVSAASSSTDASDTLPNDGIFNGAYDDDEDVGAVADFNNMDNTIAVSPIPTLRIHKDHPKGQILGDPTSAVQTRGKI
ncbi:ribonuclease H-like domain-containing protein [Tanacetum coccineum]|uniref:Ribonuclease H-like domain-containing protein n=1 Tax=Tanacetum coccineum TaxID=301880 RepID=A0ABQ5EME0_9ASTR